jgi:hypothetical protein
MINDDSFSDEHFANRGDRLNLDSTYVAHTNGQWNHLTSGCTRWCIDRLAGSRFIRECSVVESSRIDIFRITITE